MKDGRDIYRAALQHVTVALEDPELGVMAVRIDYAVRDWEVGTIPPDVIVYCKWLEKRGKGEAR